MRIKQEQWVIHSIAFVVLAIWSAIVLIPLAIMLSVAIKSPSELSVNPFGWPHQFQWQNFVEVWVRSKFGRALGNSLLITGSSIACLVVLGASAAYPLARRSERWAPIYFYFLTGIMVPFQLGMLPLYKLMLKFHLINKALGAILLYTALSLPFVIFLYVGFIKGIDRELEEAALVDGSGPFRMFWTIIFPLLKPVTSSVIIINCIFIWNDFFVALLFLSKKAVRTLPLSIFAFIGQYNNDWTSIFASVTLSVLPMIVTFLFLQRYFIQGLTSGAVKG
ncbi:MAG: carbohydrate ABC transporter permease [bacterium]|nr:carbohydrate ABC transporter permease [bacterium]